MNYTSAFEIIDNINNNNKLAYDQMGETYHVKMFFPNEKPDYGLPIQSNYSKPIMEQTFAKFKKTFFEEKDFFSLIKQEGKSDGILIEFDLSDNFSHFSLNHKKLLETLQHHIYHGFSKGINISTEEINQRINKDYFKAKINHTQMTGFYSNLLKSSEYKDFKQLIIYSECNFHNSKPQSHLNFDCKKKNRP